MANGRAQKTAPFRLFRYSKQQRPSRKGQPQFILDLCIVINTSSRDPSPNVHAAQQEHLSSMLSSWLCASSAQQQMAYSTPVQRQGILFSLSSYLSSRPCSNQNRCGKIHGYATCPNGRSNVIHISSRVFLCPVPTHSQHRATAEIELE
jgi:hypothetical protein